MAGKKNSLIDNDFEEDDDDLLSPEFGDDDEGPKGLQVEIQDDTPEADRDKWNADKTPTDVTAEEESEAEKYSKRVKARLNKETARWHAERRAKEDRERQLTEAVRLAERLMNENNNLKGYIENGEQVFMTEHQTRVESQITAAKLALREAHEAGDINGQIAAQENLARLAAIRERAASHIPQRLARNDGHELNTLVQPVQQTPQPEPEALDWQKKNKWFGRDEAMTAYAMGLHQQLVSREGILPSDGKEYWNRLDQDLHKRFPEKFQNNGGGARRSDVVVATGGRSSGAVGPRRTVTLTESQANLARRLGLTPQQYAEQLVAEHGNSTGEFIHHGRR